MSRKRICDVCGRPIETRGYIRVKKTLWHGIDGNEVERNDVCLSCWQEFKLMVDKKRRKKNQELGTPE